MAHGIKINGTSYGVTGGKCLVGGTAYDIKKGCTLVGGTGYDIAFGTPLSEYAEGDVVYINENGSPVEFYVAKHDYESSLNGAGRTLVVRKDCYDYRVWHSSNVNAWATCSMRSWLNSTYLNMLDADIRSLIGTTKYYYTPGNGNWSVTTRSDAVFLLSAYELGESASWFNNEGTTLPNATNYQIANLNGSAATQWTRSPYTVTDDYDAIFAIFLFSTGSAHYALCSNTRGSRPAFTLPSSTVVGVNGLIS